MVHEEVEDLIGKSMDDLVISDDLPLPKQENSKLMPDKIFTHDIRFKKQNGEIVCARATTGPCMLGESCGFIFSIIANLTECKRSEDTLKASVGRFKGLMNNLLLLSLFSHPKEPSWSVIALLWNRQTEP